MIWGFKTDILQPLSCQSLKGKTICVLKQVEAYENELFLSEDRNIHTILISVIEYINCPSTRGCFGSLRSTERAMLKSYSQDA
jgi:hypothetical protein